MVQALLKEFRADSGNPQGYDPETKVIRFWFHQATRLTDGHIALSADGTSRIVVNWSTRGTRREIEDRARIDADDRMADGYSEWSDAQVFSVLLALGIETGASAKETLAKAVVAPMEAAERASAERLSIQWEVDEINLGDAIGLRYMVVQKAEAILNDAGLLANPEGTVVSDERVSATLEVAEFAAARNVLLEELTPTERRYNCRIEHV